MPLLDAALAFSLTMLVVATIVTQLVEIIQRIFELRSKDLQKLVTEFGNQELIPILDRELQRFVTAGVAGASTISDNLLREAAGTAAAANLREFDIAQKPLESELRKLLGLTVPNQPALGARLAAETDTPREVTQTTRVHISTQELIEGIKKSDIGKEIYTKLGDKAQKVFDEVGRRYEEVGEKFTAAFRNNARRIGTGVAFGLALLLNIDSVHLLKSYISNPQLRESTIAQMPEITKRLDELEQATKERAKTDDAVKNLKASIGAMKSDVSDLTSSTLPIGPSQYPYFPYSCKMPPTGTTCMLWIMGIVMTGLLAGLGSPFWYDVVRGLSQLTQRSKDDKNA